MQYGKSLFCNSGFEAVEAALKTALLFTGRPNVIAFEGAYHGTGYGTLSATHRGIFHAPFASQLLRFGHFIPFPKRDADLIQTKHQIKDLCKTNKIGAILVEPIQGRGGIRVPPEGFLPLLRKLSQQHGALLILDEIFTGFGRTGEWFACEHTGIIPDLICLGKALTGGFPLSVCMGAARIMDAWPETTGEAIHTSTFSGHPVACAMALAHITEIDQKRLIERSAKLGMLALNALQALKIPGLNLSARGQGLMCGLELLLPDGSPATKIALEATKALLKQGFIVLPEGECSNVIGFTPPLVISERQINAFLRALRNVLIHLV